MTAASEPTALPRTRAARPQPAPGRLAGGVAVFAGWSLFLPVGLQYLALGALLLIAGQALHREQRWSAWRQDPMVAWTLVLLAWLGLSAAWTSATAGEAASHLGHYARLLAVPLMAWGLAAGLARRVLAHFIAASVAAALWILGWHLARAAGWAGLPPQGLPVVGVGGNQMIAVSMLLALGAGLAVAEATRPGRPVGARAGWALAAGVIAAGVLLQDRRTGWLLLPVLLALCAVARAPGTRARLLAGTAIAAVSLTVFLATPALQDRWAEGRAELGAYQPGQDVDTSWGMRVRMVELTVEMIRERPLTGQGVGSWAGQWQQRAVGGPLLMAHTTPHNEALLITAQGGAIALVLAALVAAAALRRRPVDLPMVLVWTTLVLASGANAVLRDGKLAVPLLLLAGCAAAAAAGQAGVRRPG